MKRAARQTVDWELYRHFLAVAKTGNLTAAAKRLGVSQPTVGRQVQALEDNAIAIERKVAGDDTRLSGPICISAAEGIATYWLAPR